MGGQMDGRPRQSTRRKRSPAQRRQAAGRELELEHLEAA